MRRALNLHMHRSTPRGWMIWKGEIASTRGAPSTIRTRPLTGLVPPLDEVVPDIRHGRTCDLDIDVVIVSFAVMARRDERVWIQIDTADE